jgi:hypothetical protein
VMGAFCLQSLRNHLERKLDEERRDAARWSCV